jgi:single-strand DNA-binding protein
MRYTPSGQPVASFGLATNRKWKGADGEIHEETEFHEIVAWGKLAEICNQILRKGRQVYIEGRIQTRTWEAPDGSKKSRTEIIALEMQALGSKPQELAEKVETVADVDEILEEISENPEEIILEKKPNKKETKSSDEEIEEEIDLDDIPF